MRRAMSFDSQTASSSVIRSLSTMMRISRPACSAKAFDTPLNESAMPSSFSRRFTYDSRMSRRAPGPRGGDRVGRLDDHRLERRPVDVHVVRRHRVEHRLALAVLAQELEADLEVRALHVAVDGLADVVQERRAHGHVRVEAELAGHDARRGTRPPSSGSARSGRSWCGNFSRPISLQHLGVQVEQAELEGGRLALLADLLLELRLHLLDDFLDAGRVDAAVGDEPLDGLLARSRAGTGRSPRG